jgi:hypothetical protein
MYSCTRLGELKHDCRRMVDPDAILVALARAQITLNRAVRGALNW